jgi:hypothetical protein
MVLADLFKLQEAMGRSCAQPGCHRTSALPVPTGIEVIADQRVEVLGAVPAPRGQKRLIDGQVRLLVRPVSQMISAIHSGQFGRLRMFQAAATQNAESL